MLTVASCSPASYRLSLTGVVALVVALVGAPGCKKNEPAPVATTAPVEAKMANQAANASCGADPRVAVYQPGMKVAGNSHNLSFVITQAAPTPPAGGNNTWHVQILSASGAPATGYALSAAPYMPDHAHGPATSPTVKMEGNDYVVDGIDFFMGGVWRTTLTAKDSQGNIVDAANVFLCVAG